MIMLEALINFTNLSDPSYPGEAHGFIEEIV